MKTRILAVLLALAVVLALGAPGAGGRVLPTPCRITPARVTSSARR